MPESYPFTATFRVVFEKGTVENSGGKFVLYQGDKVTDIKIEKTEIDGDAFKGGNISDLGGYYNELVYFTDCAKNGAKVEKATLKDAVDSLNFVLEEISNA